MASKKELRALITLAGKIDPSLQSAMLKATGQSMKLSQSLKQSANGLNQVGKIAKGTFLGSLAANAFSSAASSVKGFASESIQLASDLKEVQNVVDTTFGNNAKAMDAWAKQAKNSFGLSTLQAKQFSGTMGAMLKSSGVSDKAMITMSQSLTGLAGDFASFYNLDHQAAFDKIRAGLSGETEPLKQLGINMSVANLEAYALSQGIKTSWSKMDQASQTLLRYNYLMSVSKDAQGDFNKTQGEFANQQRLFNTNLKEFAATVATKALPYLTKFFQTANRFVTNIDIDRVANTAAAAFDTLSSSVDWARENSDWLIPTILGVGAAFAGLKTITFAADALKAYKLALVSTEAITAVSKGSILGLNAAMLMQKATALHATFVTGGFNAVLAANPIGATVIAIGALVAAGVALWKNWDKVKAKAAELWGAVSKYLGPIGKLFGSNKDATKLQVNGFKGYSNQSMGFRMFATGGIATKPSIFGEAGAEMAIPLKKSRRSFDLLNQTAQILGVQPVSSGINVVLNYNPTIFGGNRSELEPILQQHKEDLRQMVIDILAGEGRVQFGF